MAVLPLRAAVIDLGTNTFNLAVGQRGATGLELLHTASVAVGLGRGGIQEGFITEEALVRAMEALAQFQQTAVKMGAEELAAIGTSALRNAKNAAVLQRRALEELGLQVEVIDGQAEAELIYQGVQASGALGATPHLIVDIGGGSVEFIYGSKNALLWKTSLEIGMARLNALFPLSDPITPELLAGSETWLRERLGPVLEQISTYQIRRLTGSAGSFDTLLALENAGAAAAHPRFNLLPVHRFRHWYEYLLTASRAERAALPGMKPVRVDMMVYAMLLMRLLTDAMGVRDIQCCSWSLREGALGSALTRA